MKYRNVLLLSSICLGLILAWFHKGLLFGAGEEGIPFHNLSNYSYATKYIWGTLDGGYISLPNLPRFPISFILSIFYQIGIPNFVIQAGLFLLLMLIGTLSIYLLTKEILKDYLPTDMIPIIAGTFYLLNPYSMNQIWGRTLLSQMFPFALFPLFLLMIHMSLARQKFVYILIALISSFILSEAFAVVTYVMSLWMIVFLYFVFYLIFIAKKAKLRVFALFSFVFTLICWVGIQAWWLLPYFDVGNTLVSNSAKFFNTDNNIGVLKAVSQSSALPYLLRLQHKGYFYESAIYGDSYNSFIFQLISWIIPILTLIGIFRLRKNLYWIFLLTLFLITFVLALGANFPFGWLIILLFKLFPFLQGFRNPYEKIGVLLLIPYSIFFATGFYLITQKIKFFKPKIIIILLLIFLEGIYLWPMWTGQFAGGIKSNVWIQIPNYYNQADEWLNNHAGSYRILNMPLVPGFAVAYMWDHPYVGQVPYDSLFKTASISKDISYTLGFPHSFIEAFEKKELTQLLERFAIKYIILHKDLDYKRTGEMAPAETEKLLGSYENIKKTISFGMLDIYKVDLPWYIDRVYAPEKQLQFKQINPTLYKASITDNKDPFNLYFLESFDSKWEASINNQTLEKHFKVFDYANMWEVDKAGNFEILIQYKPQLYVDIGFKISLIFIGLLFICVGILGTKKLYKTL